MADISKVILPNNEEYNLKDTTARNNALRLGLTGAAVGDLVRVAAVDANGRPTSWNHVPLCDIVTNLNLLGNWYFIGGGNQLGDGILPINLRGLTSYTSTDSYTIDRWETSSTGSVVINNNGLTLSSTSATTRKGFSQILPKSLLGKKVTAAILLTDGRLITGSNTLPSTPTDSQQFKSFATFDGNEIRASLSSGGTLQFDVMVAASNSISVAAVKLELGSEQTLAHLESGAWVLNEIPDYEDQLIKCQTSTTDSDDNYANKSIIFVAPSESHDITEYTFDDADKTFSGTQGSVRIKDGWVTIVCQIKIKESQTSTWAGITLISGLPRRAADGAAMALTQVFDPPANQNYYMPNFGVSAGSNSLTGYIRGNSLAGKAIQVQCMYQI